MSRNDALFTWPPPKEEAADVWVAAQITRVFSEDKRLLYSTSMKARLLMGLLLTVVVGQPIEHRTAAD
jgi:hypothetical protein